MIGNISWENREKELQKEIECLTEHYNEEDLWYKNIEYVKDKNIDVSILFSYQGNEKISEMKKCISSPLYFISNYVYLEGEKNNGEVDIILFTPRSFQVEMIETFEGNRLTLVKMGRQLGKTIVCCAYFLWNVIFKDNFKIEMFANRNDLSKDNIDRIKKMYERLPLWMKPGIKKWNESAIIFENGSRIKSGVANKESGRGGTNNILFADEIGRIEDNIMAKWYSSAFPTIKSKKHSKFIGVSTPHGLNTFWRMFTEALNGINGFVALEYPWNIDGIRDEKFKEETIASLNGGYREWLQEFEAKFLGSSGTLLSAATLGKFAAIQPIQEIKLLGNDYILKIYKNAINDHNYIMTHDASEGLGDDNDYTAIHVWDITNPLKYIQVAVLNNNEIDKDDAPFIISEIGKLYNNCAEISENNFLPEIPENIIRVADYGGDVYIHSDGRYGIKMTEKQRNIGLSRMKKEFEKNRVEIFDYETIYQFSRFSKGKSGKYEGEYGVHDDLVTSANLLFWLMADEDRFERWFSDKINYFSEAKQINVPENDLPDMFIDNGNEIEFFKSGDYTNINDDDDDIF